MNLIPAKANNLTQTHQRKQSTALEPKPSLGQNASAAPVEKDEYFPSPPGLGEGPSVAEKLFRKLGSAWKRAKEQPKFVNPATPFGPIPGLGDKLPKATGIQKPLGYDPAGTGEFLG